MPLALDPEQTFDVVLSTDKKKPKDKQPAFTFRYLTSREWSRVAATFDEMQKQESGAQAIESVCESLRVGLVGWKRMVKADGTAVEFDVDELDDLLTPSEAMELLGTVMDQTVPEGDELGKSDSPQ